MPVIAQQEISLRGTGDEAGVASHARVLGLLRRYAGTTAQRARYSPRHDRKSKTPVPDLKEEERALRSGSEEGEIEED